MDNEQLEEGLELNLQYAKRGGLVPTVVQDYYTREVSVLGYADQDALNETVRTGYASFCDKIRVIDILVDCDQDALIFMNVWPAETRYTNYLKKAMNIKYDDKGLVPSIAQDYNTGDILMLGYANQLAIDKTFEKELATFWSTSRKELWTKGEKSGDKLKISAVLANRDQGSVLYVVEMVGDGACHTKKEKEGIARRSCFYRRIMDGRLEFIEGMQ